MDESQPIEMMRLSKLMALRGVCSRRQADAFIARGLVRVNGARVDVLGTKVPADAVVELEQQAQRIQQNQVTILLNKPIGFVSTQPEHGYHAAIELLVPKNQDPEFPGPPLRPQCLIGLGPAGRLDIESKGLLVFTQDGRVAKLLIGEDSTMEKEYLVRVEGQLAPGGLALLRHGLALDGQPLLPADVEWINHDQLRFILRQGKKRQIRRMCELVGLRVTGLKRVRIGEVRLGGLCEGMWRFLRAGERFDTTA